MDGETKENSVGGDESCSRSEIVESIGDSGKTKANGSAVEVDMGIGSSSRVRRGLLTYKRRKNVKVMEDGMIYDDSGNELVEKSINDSSDQVNQKTSHAVSNGSRNFSLKHQRDIVLEQICQSSEIEHGLEKCIQAALTFHPGSGSKTTAKETVHSCEAGCKSTVHIVSMHHGFEDAPKSNMGMRSSASTNGSNHDTITELCQRTLFDIITSEQFAQLCNLLIENGVKTEKLFDLSNINSRMKESVYESSPFLFQSDVQQIWEKIQKVGADMIALSKFLSDKTMSSFREQAGSFAQSASDNGRHEFPTQEYEMHKADFTDTCTHGEVHTCRSCGENADGGNALVCDSCEEMYHISCIEPPVEEIPSSSWYCTVCCANRVESPHSDCVACERLNASRSPFNGDEEDHVMCEETPRELEESSKESDRTGGGRFPCCKVCQTDVKTDEDYRICGHSLCPLKFYHVRCLTSKQLESYGPCWYCPSCLCRACFMDQDDDKIVLCDACDHAYHIYCMQPPRTTIPEGQWFCTKCEARLKRLHKAKHTYENTQIKSRKRSLDGESKAQGTLNTSGAVDMLLNAAKTLNYEENLAAMGLQAK